METSVEGSVVGELGSGVGSLLAPVSSDSKHPNMLEKIIESGNMMSPLLCDFVIAVL